MKHAAITASALLLSTVAAAAMGGHSMGGGMGFGGRSIGGMAFGTHMSNVPTMSSTMPKTTTSSMPSLMFPSRSLTTQTRLQSRTTDPDRACSFGMARDQMGMRSSMCR